MASVVPSLGRVREGLQFPPFGVRVREGLRFFSRFFAKSVSVVSVSVLFFSIPH
jgi:hypothetical protein